MKKALNTSGVISGKCFYKPVHKLNPIQEFIYTYALIPSVGADIIHVSEHP
jgi:hypothetical protein